MVSIVKDRDGYTRNLPPVDYIASQSQDVLIISFHSSLPAAGFCLQQLTPTVAINIL